MSQSYFSTRTYDFVASFTYNSIWRCRSSVLNQCTADCREWNTARFSLSGSFLTSIMDKSEHVDWNDLMGDEEMDVDEDNDAADAALWNFYTEKSGGGSQSALEGSNHGGTVVTVEEPQQQLPSPTADTNGTGVVGGGGGDLEGDGDYDVMDLECDEDTLMLDGRSDQLPVRVEGVVVAVGEKKKHAENAREAYAGVDKETASRNGRRSRRSKHRRQPHNNNNNNKGTAGRGRRARAGRLRNGSGSLCSLASLASLGPLVDRRSPTLRQTIHGDRPMHRSPQPRLRRPEWSAKERRRRWIARSVRAGYEELVYSVCDCNETPEVVFAALCYQQSDVYTMVLRNCAGKRRYWYDKAVGRREWPPSVGEPLSDFERAMRWRANNVGRGPTSPGYDLAAFVLQCVTTDKRCRLQTDSQAGTASLPLIVVTTSDILTNTSVYLQLFHPTEGSCTGIGGGGAWNRTAQQRTRGAVGGAAAAAAPVECSRTAARCYVCHGRADVVSRDSASIPTFTCWRHAPDQIVDTDTGGTRVSGAIVLDMQFAHDDQTPDGPLVCRLRLLRVGSGSGARRQPSSRHGGEPRCSWTNAAATAAVGGCSVDFLTIAELVSLPFDTLPTDSAAACEPLYRQHHNGADSPVDLATAHDHHCGELHHNVEDLFPSMPISGVASDGRNARCGGVQPYDTTIGRVVDLLHCVTTSLQK